MANLNLVRSAALALAMSASAAVAAQDAPPTAAEATQDPPLVHMEAPVDRVVAPPPASSPPVHTAPAAPTYEEVPPPACEQSATPSPCTQPRDAYRHDGFYARLSNESGYVGFFGEGPDGDASIKGFGTGGFIALGGTPVPGLVIGGLIGSAAVRGTFRGRPEGSEKKGTMSLAMLGAFVDWFPNPYDGWHVGASFGFAAISLTDAALDDSVGPAFSAKLFGGYDFWIGPQWSLGIMAGFAATPMSSLVDNEGDKNGYRLYSLSAGLGGTITLH